MRRWTVKVQPHLSELKCAAPGGAAGLYGAIRSGRAARDDTGK